MLATCIFLGLVTTIQAQLEGFIVGGEYTAIRKYPHSAYLAVKCAFEARTTPSASFICGSSLINQKIVLTAAHCFFSCNANSQIDIHMGDEHNNRGVFRTAASFMIHEKYNYNTSDRDIALAKMSRAVTFNSKISRVAIMKRPPYGNKASLAGWGMINEKHRIYTNLIKSMDQKVWRYDTCKKMLIWIPKGTICASSQRPETFATQGDSGSALIVQDYIQIGLVSYKVPFRANNLIVYTDVGFYYNWITYNAHKLFCD